MALISVIIPMNNCAAQLPETIRALQAQDWTRWEAFLVDDSSTDDSLAVAHAMALRDPRLRVIASPAPGEAAAINHTAQTRARGQIIAICRPGDVWLPVKLADVARMILTEGADAVFGAARLHRNGRMNGARSAVPDVPLSLPMLLRNNPICSLSNLSLRRNLFVELGGLLEDMPRNADLDLLIHMVGQGALVQGVDRDHVVLRPHQSPAHGATLPQALLRRMRAYGFGRSRAEQAVLARQMAGQALWIESDPAQARALVALGLRLDWRRFLRPLRFGLGTVWAAAGLPMLSRRLRWLFGAG